MFKIDVNLKDISLGYFMWTFFCWVFFHSCFREYEFEESFTYAPLNSNKGNCERRKGLTSMKHRDQKIDKGMKNVGDFTPVDFQFSK